MPMLFTNSTGRSAATLRISWKSACDWLWYHQSTAAKHTTPGGHDGHHGPLTVCTDSPLC